MANSGWRYWRLLRVEVLQLLRQLGVALLEFHSHGAQLRTERLVLALVVALQLRHRLAHILGEGLRRRLLQPCSGLNGVHARDQVVQQFGIIMGALSDVLRKLLVALLQSHKVVEPCR